MMEYAFREGASETERRVYPLVVTVKWMGFPEMTQLPLKIQQSRPTEYTTLILQAERAFEEFW